MTQQASDQAPASGQIGPYRVLSTIARGGMGVVYRAVHVDTGNLVALKTVHAPEASLVRGIRREIHALRRIEHPGVVKILDEQVDTGTPWYAMELFEGRTLRDRLNEWWTGVPIIKTDGEDRPTREDAVSGDRRISETTVRGAPLSELSPSAPPRESVASPRPAANGHLLEALTLVRGLCASLAYLHGEGIVHRDLKPENVIVRADGEPVLVDFGLVTGHGGAIGRESLDVAGSLEGSFGYMAPEQVNGLLLDARADLYALGCILYEVVTGRLPFQGQAFALSAR